MRTLCRSGPRPRARNPRPPSQSPLVVLLRPSRRRSLKAEDLPGAACPANRLNVRPAHHRAVCADLDLRCSRAVRTRPECPRRAACTSLVESPTINVWAGATCNDAQANSKGCGSGLRRIHQSPPALRNDKRNAPPWQHASPCPVRAVARVQVVRPPSVRPGRSCDARRPAEPEAIHILRWLDSGPTRYRRRYRVACRRHRTAPPRSVCRAIRLVREDICRH